jgi:hypothetical protein
MGIACIVHNTGFFGFTGGLQRAFCARSEVELVRVPIARCADVVRGRRRLLVAIGRKDGQLRREVRQQDSMSPAFFSRCDHASCVAGGIREDALALT